MSSTMPLLASIAAFLSLASGCAVLHSTQIGEIDSQIVLEGRRFDIKVTEIGVDLEEMFDNGDEEEGDLGDLIALFNQGPRTGTPVFFDDYSDGIADRLWRQCPSGNISGLMAIRETNDYGPVSGEVVRLVGYCHQRKDRRQ